jgi:hypothetical protein
VKRFFARAGLMCLLGAASPRAFAAEPAAIVVITENDGLAAADEKAALAAAVDVLAGNVDFGAHPEKVGPILKARGHDPLQCGAEVKCLAQLGSEASARYVIAIGIGVVTGDYPVSVTLVDVANEKVVAHQSTLSHVKPDWSDVLRDLLGQVMPEGTLRFSSRIAVTADAFNAEVLVDDVLVGTTPLDHPLPVAPGSHRVRLQKEGYQPYSTSVDVEPAGEARVDAKLPLIPPPPPEPPSRPFRIAAVSGAGVTVVGIIVTVALQVKMNQAATTFINACESVVSNPSACSGGGQVVVPPGDTAAAQTLSELENSHNIARTRWAVSLGTTIAVAATTGGLFYWDLTHPPAPVSVAVGPGSLSLVAKF